MSYNFYAEDNRNHYYFTGKILGDWWKFRERRAICKLCGMDYQLAQYHGVIDLTQCVPRGTGFTSKGEVCTECGRRVDEAIQLKRNQLEDIAICPECLREHHGLDLFDYKIQLLRSVLEMTRRVWEG